MKISYCNAVLHVRLGIISNANGVPNMPKTKLTVTLPDGSIATRTTARTYTHVVAVRRSYEYALEKSVLFADLDRANFEYFSRMLDGTSPFLRQASYRTAEQQAEYNADCVARATKALEGHDTLEGYTAAKRAARLDSVERDKEAGLFDKWSAESWAGRLDLAQKAAVHQPWFAEVRIIPVN